MRRLALPLLAVLLLAACPGGGTPSGTDDGGGVTDGGLAGTDGGADDRDGGAPPDGGSEADAGPVDAGERDAGPTDAGVGPVSCADPDAVACLSNPDCPAGEICAVDAADPDARCCVPGTPGAGEVGDPCAGPEDCAFGRCIARDDGQAFCSGECAGDLDCPVRFSCSDVFHWCVPWDTTVPVQSCSELSLDQCFYNDNCAADARCEDVGGPEGEVLCCTTGPRGTKAVGEACTDHVECAFGRCLGGLCSEACDFDVDPCPPETMVCNTIRGLCEPL